MSAQLYLPGLNVGWGKYTASLRVTSSMQQPNINLVYILQIVRGCLEYLTIAGVYMASPSKYHSHYFLTWNPTKSSPIGK